MTAAKASEAFQREREAELQARMQIWQGKRRASKQQGWGLSTNQLKRKIWDHIFYIQISNEGYFLYHHVIQYVCVMQDVSLLSDFHPDAVDEKNHPTSQFIRPNLLVNQ